MTEPCPPSETAVTSVLVHSVLFSEICNSEHTHTHTPCPCRIICNILILRLHCPILPIFPVSIRLSISFSILCNRKTIQLAFFLCAWEIYRQWKVTQVRPVFWLLYSWCLPTLTQESAAQLPQIGLTCAIFQCLEIYLDDPSIAAAAKHSPSASVSHLE